MITYKGYSGSVHYSEEDRVFYGKVEFIRALLSYEGTDVDGLESNFRAAIDSYLSHCAQKGQKPETPFKGSFNVRIGPDLHRQVAVYAQQSGLSLNKVVSRALENFVVLS